METNNKSKIILIVLVIFVGVFVYWFNNYVTKEKLTNEDKGVETSMPVPGKGDVPEIVVEDNFYTMEDVAQNNIPANCWTAVNGGVYDLTQWINAHPGGDKAILGLCGIDATEAFKKQHDGQENPLKALEGFKIGNIK